MPGVAVSVRGDPHLRSAAFVGESWSASRIASTDGGGIRMHGDPYGGARAYLFQRGGSSKARIDAPATPFLIVTEGAPSDR